MTQHTKLFSRFGSSLLAAAVWLAMAGPTAAADPKGGQDLARKWCAQCHVIEDDQLDASADVPTFESVSNRADFDPEKLKVFLIDPHPVMPNTSLTRFEIEDLVAYIGSLRNKQ